MNAAIVAEAMLPGVAGGTDRWAGGCVQPGGTFFANWGGASISWSWSLDGWIVAAGILCAVASSLLGSFLVLRRMSLLGDAISHAVLPGLAAAFLISGSRSSGWMFVGAVIVGVWTALLTDWIHRRGGVDEGASMGVVFTTLFAAGLVLIVIAADRVDLDPKCVLYGAIEQVPLDQWTWTLPGGLEAKMPRVVWVLAIVTLIDAAFVVAFFKELKIATFDPALATASGFSATLMHYALMTLVAVTAVACFESVGNILVVAMLVVPPATAYLLTDRLGVLIGLACSLGAVAAVAGHVAAVVVPGWFGFGSTTTAGMMAVATGLFFLIALVFSPSQGLVPVLVRRVRLSWSILSDDILALLYRVEERRAGPSETGEVVSSLLPQNQAPLDWIAEILLARPAAVRLALAVHRRRGRIRPVATGDRSSGGKSQTEASGKHTSALPRLTPSGKRQAESLVRSHRLWEQYLVTQGDVPGERIHDHAHQLEHFTDPKLQERLSDQTDRPETDPHGRPIPSAADEPPEPPRQ